MKTIEAFLVFLFLPVLLLACEQKSVSREGFIASGYQKPGADVRLLKNNISIAEVGETLDFSLLLQTGHSRGKLFVQLASSDGLEILEGDLSSEIVLRSAPIYGVPLVIYASRQGKHYLPISVVLELPNGQTMQRSLSLIVRVGEQPMERSRSSSQVDRDGRLIKSLPAEEDIR